MIKRDQRSIGRAYNDVLDGLATERGLEAVVFLHDDVRIVETDLRGKIRMAMAEPDVAVVGVVGGRNPTTMSWASGVPVGRVVEVSDLDGTRREATGDPSSGTNDVDTIDGLFMAFSPWAAANLRFDDRRFPRFDGYDADVCAQARMMGKRVLTVDIEVEHVFPSFHHKARLRSANRQAALTWLAKWRVDQPRWRRELWSLRARFLPFEYRLRRIPWRS